MSKCSILKIKYLVPGIASLLLLVFFIGCGYSSRSILKQNVSSMYIPIFDNKTFRRGIEFGLTKAIKNEIMFKTQLKLADTENSDSILEGEIVDYTEKVLIVDSNDNIVETRIYIAVNFTWKDLRTGRIIAKAENVVAPAEFVVKRGETIETAQNESFVDLAEVIVDSMNEKW